MTKKDVLALHNQLTAYQHVRGNIKFSYAVVRNIAHLKSEVEALKKVSEDYQKGRDEIIKAAVKKDKKGEDILENGRPVYKNEKALTKELEDYDVKEKKFLDSYNKILEEEVDVKLYKVPLEAFEGLIVSGEGKDFPVHLSGFEMTVFEKIVKEE